MIDKFARYWLGLTAVSLLFLLTACAQPTATPTVTATAVPATATASPPTPTPEPTATPTLTVEELRDQRATAVLITLPGYDPAHHDALLPLARHLWGESDLVDPAEVTIVAGETAVQVTSDAAYPSGTLFVWNADSHPQPLILTGRPDSAISRGEVAFGAASLNTWVRYDVDGNVLEFVDPAGNWISPLDIQTDGRFSFFTQERILADGSRENTNTVWWANGGRPVELTTSPDPGLSLTDFLTANADLQLTQTEGPNGRHLVALMDTDTQELRYTLDESGTWTTVEQAADLYVIPEPIYEPLVFHVSSDADRTPAISRVLPDGVTQYVDRLYTSAEMTEIFRATGFEPTEGLACSQIDGYRYNVAGVIVGFEDNVTMRIGNEDVVGQTLYWQTCVRDDQGNYGSTVMQNRYHRSPSQEGGLVFQDLNGNPLPINGAFLPETKQRLIGRFIVFTNLGQIAVTNETDMLVYDLVNPFKNGSQALRNGQLPSPETNINTVGHLALTGAIVQIDNRR